MATCPHCGHEPPAGSLFCNGCGGKLAIVCASCGATPPPGSHFCNGCGASLVPSAVASPAPAPEERKVISILFVDLMGSTALQERLDPESVNRVMDAYYRAVRGPVEAGGGKVVQLLGDGVLCAFGIPRVAEDDALRAVRAAVEIQQAFRTFVQTQQWLNVPIGLRVAINTGEVVVSDEHPAGIGDPLNVAARLQQEARDGEVLIGPATRRLVAAAVTLERAGVFNLKGRADTVTAYRVVSLERPSGATTAAFVGRDDELARITAVYDAAIAEPAARLAVVLGSPGLGKSRLIDEVALRLGDGATVITAQCDAAGGATFAPIARAVRAFRRVEGDAGTSALAALIASEPDRDRIASGMAALLEGKAASPEETFFVIRRFLTALAGSKPVVLVIDDLHWAEPLLLDLVEHLVQWGGGVRLLVLVGARPELRDLRSSLVTPGGFVSDVVTLAGLDASAAMRLAANAIGAADLPSAVAAKVLATSEGNPLFVGELVRMLVDEGALERSGDRWIIGANLASIEMPPTIHALLAARIERLRPEERAVLEHAAVVGRHFSRSAVAALLGGNGSSLDARLEALRRTELIEPDVGWFLGEPVLRFHHVLIRDAAYRRLLKGTRAVLHQRLADWIEAQVGDAPEHDETIGWHLEQAHQHLRELGPLDDAGRSLGDRAARRLAAAGRRALAGDDVALAASLLGRAIERLDPGDPSRAELALDWCEALLSAGDVAPAVKAIDELVRFASESSRLRAWHTCFTGQLTALTAPQNLQAAADEVAAAADELAKLGDAAGEAKAHSVHAQALARLGKVGACEAALDRALAAARKAGDRRRANAVLAGAPVAALGGPSPVTRASGRCLDVVRVLRITQGAPAVEAVALSCQGVLEALRGRTDAARRMIASSRKMVEELGIAHRLFEADVFAARIDLLEGDAASAERTLRGAYEGLRDLGLGIDAARASALLARAQLAQGRVAEAEASSRESEALAGDDLQAAIAWRGVRAEALAQRGEIEAAVELAQAAVAIAAATDALLDHADARVALAAALRAAGRDGEADVEERRAVELWEAKGATLLAERARRNERAPMSSPAPVRAAATTTAAHRLLRLNTAAATIAALDAGFARGDNEALVLLSDAYHELDHRTGATWNRDGAVESVRRLLRSRDPQYTNRPLATLGDSLVLLSRWVGASGAAGGRFDVGEYGSEALSVLETDARGLICWQETFAADRLGDAVARLYERYAELLPEGPARKQVAGTLELMRAVLGRLDFDRLAAILGPDVAFADHRRLGLPSSQGREAYLQSLRVLFDSSEDVSNRLDDILALGPAAFTFSLTNHGTDRVSGGVFERPMVFLAAVGADGLASHWEFFDSGREAEALARFDVLTADPTRIAVRRRVRANTATRSVEHFTAVLAARDEEALSQLFDESLRVVHHPTSLTYGRREMLTTWRSLVRARRLDFWNASLASLGDSLTLDRHLLSFEGFQEAHLAEVGLSELEEIVLIETDDRGRWIHVEIFGADRLGDAIVRLYERHAERLPEGPARTRVAGVARSLAAQNGPIDLDAIANAYDPTLRNIDHRLLSTWNARSAEEMLGHYRQQLELAPDLAARFDDVVALEADALVAFWTLFGTARDSGGPFEYRLCVLRRFGADGRLSHTEVYEAEQVADALARFDAIVAGEAVRISEPFANAASNADRRLFDCFNARDWPNIEALAAPDLTFDERRRMLHNTCGREVWLEQFRVVFDVPESHFTTKVLATRGDRLSLNLHCFTGEVAGGGGPLAIDDHLVLHEVDRAGRIAAIVLFDLEDEDAAYAELDARWQAGEGATHAQAAAWDAALDAAVDRRDWEALARLFAPEFVGHDHRLVGWGTQHGPAAFVVAVRAMVELSPDVRTRTQHLRASHRALLQDKLWFGTRDGGAFESAFVGVIELDGGGRALRIDLYDPHHLEQALARFAELAAPSAPQSPFANAASATAERVIAAIIAHDWEGFARLLSDDFHMSDRRRVVQLELDKAQYVEFTREVAEGRSARGESLLIATRGERLALNRSRFEFSDADVGPSEISFLILTEVDAHGRIAAYARWDLEDLDAAYAELDARFASGEARQHVRASAWATEYRRAVAARDWKEMEAQAAHNEVAENHRLVGWGTLRGPSAWVVTVIELVKMAPDVEFRVDHLRTSERGILIACAWQGTRDGGPFETPILLVVELDEDGHQIRLDVWEHEMLHEALARFAEIAANTKITTAAAAVQRAWAVFDAGDFDAARAVCAPGFIWEDRRPLVGLAGDVELMIASARERLASGARHERREILGTAGDRVVIGRVLWAGGPADGRFEVEFLVVHEVDESGLCTAMIFLDPDDLAAAQREASARQAAIEK